MTFDYAIVGNTYVCNKVNPSSLRADVQRFLLTYLSWVFVIYSERKGATLFVAKLEQSHEPLSAVVFFRDKVFNGLEPYDTCGLILVPHDSFIMDAARDAATSIMAAGGLSIVRIGGVEALTPWMARRLYEASF